MKLNKSAPTRLLGALMLCSVLVMGAMPMTGCNGKDVAQNIVNFSPSIESSAQALDALGPVFAISDPAAAPVVAMISSGIKAVVPVQLAAAQAYLANPSATNLAKLQSVIVSLQQNVNAGLLAAVKIANPASQNKVLADIQILAVAVNAVLALVQSVSSKTAVAQMASQSTIKLAEVRPYMEEWRLRPVAKSYGTTVDGFYAYEAHAGF